MRHDTATQHSQRQDQRRRAVAKGAAAPPVGTSPWRAVATCSSCEQRGCRIAATGGRSAQEVHVESRMPRDFLKAWKPLQETRQQHTHTGALHGTRAERQQARQPCRSGSRQGGTLVLVFLYERSAEVNQIYGDFVL